MVVHTWSNDLVEIRHTHMRDNKWPLHTPHSRIQHAKNYFLVYLRQGNASDLDVECPKLHVVNTMQYLRDRWSKICHKQMLKGQMHIGKCQPNSNTNCTNNGGHLDSGFRGVQGPNEVWAQRLQRYNFLAAAFPIVLRRRQAGWLTDVVYHSIV